MELVHAKLARGTDMAKQVVYQLSLVFGSPIRGTKGESIADGRTVNMSFINGMPPEDFIIGLRGLADHIEVEYLPEKKEDG